MELVWLAFSWALFVVTLIFLAQRESKVRPIAASLGLTFLRLTIASVVIGFGYGLEPALWAGIQNGPEKGLEELGRLLGDHWYRLLTSGFLPACLGLTAASSAATKQAGMQRAVIVVILALMVADVFWSVANSRPIENLIFSLFSDVFGGLIAGLFVGWLAGWRAATSRPAPAASTPAEAV